MKRAKGSFGKPRELEEEHVPTAAKLAAIGFQKAAHDGGVRDVEDGEFGDTMRMEERHAPGNGGAPIVASKENTLLGELIGDGEDIRNEMGKRVRGNASRLGACVVTALIGDDDAKTRRGERLDLPVPGIPKFGKTVEEKNDRSVRAAGGDGVEFDGAVMKIQVFESEWHRCRVYARKRRLWEWEQTLRRKGCELLCDQQQPLPREGASVRRGQVMEVVSRP